MGKLQIMAGVMVCASLAVSAQAEAVAALYQCERSVELPVVYVEGVDSTGVAVLLV